jgi:hypothetical protein
VDWLLGIVVTTVAARRKAVFYPQLEEPRDVGAMRPGF